MTISDVARRLVVELIGSDLQVRIDLPDRSHMGPQDATTSVRLNSDDAVRYLLRSPGELGFARAYVSGELDIIGDIFEFLSMNRSVAGLRISPMALARILPLAGFDAIYKQPPIPPEEVRFGSVLTSHTRHRDEKAISHHYDVSNDFYQLVLGPSWTYSCAVFEDPTDTLETAQANKYELICRKLGLQPGMRLLDVGCGWGGMVMHAAENFGVEAVGVTISEQQSALARQRVREAGLEDRVEVRRQDYRDLAGEKGFDAISSIGMFEHVGERQLRDYFSILHALLPDGGRLLNHQIGRVPPIGPKHRFRKNTARVDPNGFVHRYVFPDGELHEIGDLIGDMQRIGFEVRHMESLREHYALTLRRWVRNLEHHWDEAVALSGEGRARVWRLYMAASAVMFESADLQVHQVLATRTPRLEGRSGFGLRPWWERTPLGARTTIDLREQAGQPDQRVETS